VGDGAEVVVLGSGAAGLSAALAAADRGARVTLLEAAQKAGGTTALSGGIAWMPGYPADDTTAEGERYLEAIGLGDRNAELCEVFVREAAGVAHELADASELAWQPLAYPDYHAEEPGGRPQGGRSLEPLPLAASAELAAQVRDAPNVELPITYHELATGEVDRELAAQRTRDGVLTLGRALVAALLDAARQRGVAVRFGVRPQQLVFAGGAVAGVVLDDGTTLGGRVVLACGGFERDEGLVRALLRGPMLAPAGVPTNRGDGLRMAQAAGASMGNLSEAWWAPAMRVPGETIDGCAMFRVVLTERARPGSVIVDSRGRRFADEAQNYNDFGRSLHEFDPAAMAFPRVPAWMVFDSRYRSSYSVGPLRRRSPDADWLARGADVGALAARIGVPADALEQTLERFNELARGGSDADFGRGDYAYDRFMGDSRCANPVLATIEEPPFYALELLPGCLGTKGGPRTDSHGRVLGADAATPLDGLYAAGNAAASPFGFAYPGAGGTIGPALVFGHRAGRAAASD
jgi:succinate dehydrogenase/fumarate reductase flavoprotein subunit